MDLTKYQGENIFWVTYKKLYYVDEADLWSRDSTVGECDGVRFPASLDFPEEAVQVCSWHIKPHLPAGK